jgi:hypothetical protein
LGEVVPSLQVTGVALEAPEVEPPEAAAAEGVAAATGAAAVLPAADVVDVDELAAAVAVLSIPP